MLSVSNLAVSTVGIGRQIVSVATANLSGLTNNATYGVTAEHGVQLTASATGASSWQWQRRATTNDAWSNISGAIFSTFTPYIEVNADDEGQIRAIPNGDTSAASAPYTVRWPPPVATANGAISGALVDGQTLTRTAATFTVYGEAVTGTDDHVTIAFEWLSSVGAGFSATGNTSSTLTAATGFRYRIRTTCTTSGGSVSVDSPAVGPVAAAAGLTFTDNADGSFDLENFETIAAPTFTDNEDATFDLGFN